MSRAFGSISDDAVQHFPSVSQTSGIFQSYVEQGHDMIVEVEHPRAGRLELMGCPVRMSETPWRLRHAPPLAGEHTDEILGEVLSQKEIAALREREVVA